MKVIILAGGLGTRLSEETETKPKPMVTIGGKPVLWHIMKLYSYYGFNDFIICLGYKGDYVKEYFAHYYLHESDVTFDFTSKDKKIIHSQTAEPWRVTLVNTELKTMTGGRLKRVKKYIGNEKFMLTYGDGVSDVNIPDLLNFHNTNKKTITVTASQPTGRFGSLDIAENNLITGFREKPKGDNLWVNSGFMVVEPEFLDYIDGDSTILEHEPMDKAINNNQLVAYKHQGFWFPMDTIRDKNHLEELWNTGKAPWKLWT
jgi:glucose-1-phosphate cytidylyltransferase